MGISFGSFEGQDFKKRWHECLIRLLEEMSHYNKLDSTNAVRNEHSNHANHPVIRIHKFMNYAAEDVIRCLEIGCNKD
ncbi:hypothetical protein CEXT_546221 [Caerostris extrusa]|uniref:Uncharacterized protein n=1 Tax=Caerostris extrusa TaxID=172846 RepID=A0AAV4NVP2_CAEEX|nr:hypothetical protein CEXT_546221 [Caerostris extrusa]